MSDIDTAIINKLDIDNEDAAEDAAEELPRCIVELATHYEQNKFEIRQDRTIKFLNDSPENNEFIFKEIQDVGLDNFFKRIDNIDDCVDGIYELIEVNFSHDEETGTTDWDYRLIPEYLVTK